MRRGLRRFLHAVSPVVVLPGLLIDWSTGRAVLFAVAAVAILLEVVRMMVPSVREALVQAVPVWRAHETRAPSGATWLAVGYAIAGLAGMAAGLGGILAAAWGDTAASMAGGRFGGGRHKSLAGTLAGFVVMTAVVIGVGYPAPVAVTAALAGAALERWATSPDDNFWIAPGVTFVLVAFA